MDPTQLGPAALAALATGVGAPAWAAAVMLVIDTIKSVPEFATRINGHEKLMAFVLSALVVVAAFVVALQVSPPVAELSVGGFVLAGMSWFTVARLAMALHDDKSQKPGSLTEPSQATKDARDDVIDDMIPAVPPAPVVIGATPDGDQP